MDAVKQIVFLICLMFSSASLAGQNLGAVMFLGDSITVGAHSTYAGYRGYLVERLLGAGYTFTTVGAATGYVEGASGFAAIFNATYSNQEGRPGAKILDLYCADPDHTGYPAGPTERDKHTGEFAQKAVTRFQPAIVYLMIGSNDLMGDTPSATSAVYQAANLRNELALIDLIHKVDPKLRHIYVEPPPSYVTSADYTSFSNALGAALADPKYPHRATTTFVNSRLRLTSVSFYHDTIERGDLHPNDEGYKIIADDLFAATSKQ